MKKAAVVLIVLVLLLTAAIGYELFRTTLQVTGKNVQVFPATERESEFSALQRAADNNAVQGTLLRRVEWQGAENYTYHVYTLRLKNPGLIRAEMVELQIAPIPEDILFYGEGGEVTLGPGETKDLSIVLLTEGQPHPVRDIKITYYLWGHPQEVKFTYDNAR